MGNFLDRYQVLKLKMDQLNRLNSPITPKEIEAVINSLPTSKSPGPDKFSAEFFQIYKNDLIPILFKFFHKIEIEGIELFLKFNLFFIFPYSIPDSPIHPPTFPHPTPPPYHLYLHMDAPTSHNT
jgi:hypothetical protein